METCVQDGGCKERYYVVALSKKKWDEMVPIAVHPIQVPQKCMSSQNYLEKGRVKTPLQVIFATCILLGIIALTACLGDTTENVLLGQLLQVSPLKDFP